MSTARLDLLLHPVRLRLVHALHLARMLTTSGLCAGAAGCAQSHCVPAGQTPRARRGVRGRERAAVRGAVECRTGWPRAAPWWTPRPPGSMTLEDHRRGFTAAMAALIGDFSAYSSSPVARTRWPTRCPTVSSRCGPTDGAVAARHGLPANAPGSELNNKPAAAAFHTWSARYSSQLSARPPKERNGKGRKDQTRHGCILEAGQLEDNHPEVPPRA